MLVSRSLTRQAISNIALALGLALGAVLCYLLAAPFVAAIVWSATLAVLFSPLDARIGKKIRFPGLSAAATVAITAIIVVAPAILVAGTLLNEAVRSTAVINALIDAQSWTRAMEAHPRLAPVLQWINERLDIPDLVKALASWLAGWSGSVVSASFSGVVSLFLTFYFLFYLLRDRSEAVAVIRQNLPLSESEFARVADRVVDTIFATVLGTAAVAALQGGLGGAMFWWLGLPAPVLWGVLMGLLAIVPFLGAFVIWAPTAAFLALSGNYSSAIILAVWGTIVVGLVDNVVYPILVGNKLKMHTVLSFIAVVGGLMLLGAPGVVLGPLIVAVSLTLIEIWRQRTVGRVEVA
ncbi:AI-2E family transporter [Bradyrhizobium sediminis]|uniref:AI-2E family transporter n=1 Tax=Bradyrhizobium sediminis TaxID=2840469 RepID=A0A975P192_9BRAD|nr:AI-2E family transporter [Bradyrhizobium sediminis]QWG24456.1 AI-2E family transporter [Bradyrhizobium sediminis]